MNLGKTVKKTLEAGLRPQQEQQVVLAPPGFLGEIWENISEWSECFSIKALFLQCSECPPKTPAPML